MKSYLKAMRRGYHVANDRLAQELDLSRRFPGYFTRPVFSGAFILTVGFALYALHSAGAITRDGVDFSAKEYWSCSAQSMTPCEFKIYDPLCMPPNPLCTPTSTLVVPPGTVIGEVPPWSMQYFSTVVLGIFLVAFGVNHLLYRRNI